MIEDANSLSHSAASSYPAELARQLWDRWNELGLDRSSLPELPKLQSLIDTAYQASLLQEESQPVRCRVMIVASDDVELHGFETDGELHVLRLDHSYRFSPHDVRKIAPAAGFYRTLLGVQADAAQSGNATIWGMIISGTGWVNQSPSAGDDSSPLPRRLVIQIRGPGHLVFAAGLQRVLETIGGRILTEGFDPFRSNWLPQHFQSVRASLLAQIETDPQGIGEVRLCDSFVRDVAQSLIRRVLSLVRNRRHGGMLIYLADDVDGRLQDWLRFRIRFVRDEATNRYQRLMLRLMRRALEIGRELGMAEVTWNEFQQMQDTSLGTFHEAIVEFSHFLADLMSVDGALVLTRDFRIVGFGGEILGDSHVKHVERAIDLEAVNSVTEAADNAGTRHRSAYRLVSGLRDAIAVVISQDGEVRFVAHRDERLVYWPYLP